MKVTKFTAISTLAVLAVAAIGGSQSVQAADSVASSKATITFDGATKNPVDPSLPGTDPENPETPKPDENGGDGKDDNESNLLRLAYVSALNFGTHEVPAADTVYQAKVVSTEQAGAATGNYVAPFIKISDIRYQAADETARATGWSLNVKWDAVPTSASNETLDGATLTLNAKAFGQGTIAAKKVVVSTADAVLMGAATENGKNITFGTFGEVVGTESNPTFEVYGAEDTVSGATLKVKGGSAKADQTYTSTLTWTLAATPYAG